MSAKAAFVDATVSKVAWMRFADLVARYGSAVLQSGYRGHNGEPATGQKRPSAAAYPCRLWGTSGHLMRIVLASIPIPNVKFQLLLKYNSVGLHQRK